MIMLATVVLFGINPMLSVKAENISKEQKKAYIESLDNLKKITGTTSENASLFLYDFENDKNKEMVVWGYYEGSRQGYTIIYSYKNGKVKSQVLDGIPNKISSKGIQTSFGYVYMGGMEVHSITCYYIVDKSGKFKEKYEKSVEEKFDGNTMAVTEMERVKITGNKSTKIKKAAFDQAIKKYKLKKLPKSYIGTKENIDRMFSQ